MAPGRDRQSHRLLRQIYFRWQPDEFDNATINLGSTSGGSEGLENYDTDGNGAVLTLGSNLVINDNDDLGYNDTLSSNGYVQTGDGIVNKGKINVTGGSGGYLTINSDTFTNRGTIPSPMAARSISILAIA